MVVAAVGWARTAILRIMPELVCERAATVEPTRPLFASVSQPAGLRSERRKASGRHRPRRSPASSMARSSPRLPVAWSPPRLLSPRATVVADAGDGWLAGARGIRVGGTAGLPSAPRVPASKEWPWLSTLRPVRRRLRLAGRVASRGPPPVSSPTRRRAYRRPSGARRSRRTGGWARTTLTSRLRWTPCSLRRRSARCGASTRVCQGCGSAFS